jgi:Flp pilus assembly protein TadG
METALLLPMLFIFTFGIVDFSRAIYDAAVIKNLSGEGSSLASRGTSLSDTAAIVVGDAGSDLDMASNDCVIVTSVIPTNNATTFTITGQAISNPCQSANSKLGCVPPPDTCTGQTKTLPPQVGAVIFANPNYTGYITEVFYNFSPITPIGAFLKNSHLLPNQLYSAVYM